MSGGWFDDKLREKRDQDWHGKRQSSSDGRNSESQRLFHAGLVAALAFAMASGVGAPFVAAVLKDLLLFGALGFMLAAVFRRDRFFAPRFTAWDQAALLTLLSLICSLFVDPQAVQQALAERGLLDAGGAN